MNDIGNKFGLKCKVTCKNMRRLCQYKNVDVIHFMKPSQTLKNQPDLIKKILTDCRAIQHDVWNPRQSIEENTINTDILLLLSTQNKYVGFLSANYEKIGNYGIAYLHDIMISRDYQGMGFCRLLSLLLVIEVFGCFAVSKFNLVTATSNSRLVSALYTKHNIFKDISFPIPNEFHKMLLKLLGDKFFHGKKINVATGVIKNMWSPPPDNKQHISNAKNLTSLFGKKIPLESGDALALIASIDEEAILNTNSYLRGLLNVTYIDVDL